MQVSRLTATAAVTAFFAFPLYLISENSGAEAGRSGGPFPGEQSCGTSRCHNTTPNTGPGRVFVTVNGNPIDQYRYTPGETVQLTVRIEDPEQGRWGFQLTARNSSDGCQSEGNLAPIDGTVQVDSGIPVDPCAGPQYATHQFPPKLGVGGQEYSLNWTAPATDVGPIVFAAAGNAANGNSMRGGDRIYTTVEEVEPAALEPLPKPAISEGGIVLATLVPSVSSAAPNAIVSVFGQEFAAPGTSALQPQLDGEDRVSTKMAGVCVEIGGHRSPMFAVLEGQLNLQASDQVGLGPQAVTVIRGCDQPNEERSDPVMLDFADAAPGFFVFANFGGEDGKNPIAALHGGGPNVVAPDGLFQDNEQQTFSPAAAGDIVSLFATGLGSTVEPVPAGEIPNRAVALERTARVTIGGIELPAEDVFYAGVAPCCAGLYQLTVKVPEELGPGQHEVTVMVDGVASPPGPFLPVE